MAVGIPGGIKPLNCHPFAIVRTGQELVDIPLIGVRLLVGKKGCHRCRRRRQTRQVKRKPTGKGYPFGLGVRRESLIFKPGSDEPVDWCQRPVLVGHFRHRWPLNPFEGPVVTVLCTCGNPTGQQLALGWANRLAHFRRRHHDIGVAAGDPGQQFTCRCISRHNRRQAAAKFGLRRHRIIQPQSGLAIFLIRPMTGKTPIGEQWPDIAIEIDCISRNRTSG